MCPIPIKSLLIMIRLLIPILLSIISCKSNHKSSRAGGDLAEKWKQIAMEKYGDTGEAILSPDRKYVLMKGKTANSSQTVYSVFASEDEAVKAEDITYSGAISWYDTHRLEIFNTPGIMPPSKNRNDFIVIHDVETGTRQKKSALEGDDTR